MLSGTFNLNSVNQCHRLILNILDFLHPITTTAAFEAVDWLADLPQQTWPQACFRDDSGIAHIGEIPPRKILQYSTASLGETVRINLCRMQDGVGYIVGILFIECDLFCIIFDQSFLCCIFRSVR